MTDNASPTVALRVRDAEVSYGPIRAVRGVSLDVVDREITALVGANGAGKSSLLKAVAGLVPLRAGRVELPVGRDIARVQAHKRVQDLGIALVLEGRGIFAQMTVEENLLVGRRVGERRERGEGAVDRVFDLFPALKARHKTGAGFLSGGEQQMLAIARALLTEPRVLLVDEPSTGLAPKLVQEIFERMGELMHADHLAILLVEQNTQIALSVSQRAYVIERGRIVLDGLSNEVLLDPRLHGAYLSN